MNSVYGFVIINQSTQSKNQINRSTFTSSLLLSSSSEGNGKKGDDPILRDEWAQDLASAGGDPYFLPDGYSDEDEWYGDVSSSDDNSNSAVEEDAEMPSMTLLGMAGIPSILGAMSKDKDEEGIIEEEEDFAWDGVEDEDAHFD